MPSLYDREGADTRLRGTSVARRVKLDRNTKETQISVDLELDGTGQRTIQTPLPFLSHMLDAFARHGVFDLAVTAAGDIEIDGHHTVEDIGLGPPHPLRHTRRGPARP